MQSVDLVTEQKRKLEIEEILWTCKRCDKPIKGISKLVGHNEECYSDDSRFTCPVCEEHNDDDVALKNHILAVHLDPELLNIKEEPQIAVGVEDEDRFCGEYEESEDTEGNNKKSRRRRSIRKSTKKSSFLNDNFEDGDLVPFGTHFLDGYGK